MPPTDQPRPVPSRPEPALPGELVAALAAAPEARERFDALAPSHRREYVKWVAEARRDDARERRAAQTVMRLLEQRESAKILEDGEPTTERSEDDQ